MVRRGVGFRKPRGDSFWGFPRNLSVGWRDTDFIGLVKRPEIPTSPYFLVLRGAKSGGAGPTYPGNQGRRILERRCDVSWIPGRRILESGTHGAHRETPGDLSHLVKFRQLLPNVQFFGTLSYILSVSLNAQRALVSHTFWCSGSRNR